MAEKKATDIRDVADFLLRWAEFRPPAQAASLADALPEDQRKVLSWLIQLADRVGESDVAPQLPASHHIEESCRKKPAHLDQRTK
jgi:hypothetical protein